MTWDTIVAWVIRCIILLYVLITAIVAVIKKRRKPVVGDDLDVSDDSDISLFEKIASSAIQFIGEAEKSFNNLIGDSNKKAGTMKLDNVLSKLRQLCGDLDFDFDIQYWTNFVNKIVENMNIKKDDGEEQSIQVDKISVNEKQSTQMDKVDAIKNDEEVIGYVEIHDPITYEPKEIPVKRKKFSFEE